MQSIYRWWDRNRLTVLIGGATVIGVGVLKAFNLLPVREVYNFISQPFQASASDIAEQVQTSQSNLEEKIKVLEAQNLELTKQLKQPETKRSNSVTALVTGRAIDQWWQHVYLNQGNKKGLTPDAVVESSGVLVGRVIEATPNSSQVLLLSDPDSRLAVLLSRSRSVGILQGDRNNQGILEFFDQDPNVQIGDKVVTSPLSCLFPPNIPVGVVKSIDNSKKTAIQARVEFSVPLGRLEWVRAYQYEKTKTKTAAAASTCP